MELNKIKTLNDHQLLEATEILVKTEREILLSVLHHLQEIDRRKLYSALKFKSLFEYVVKKLGYSEDQAYRRISAIRMLKSFPDETAQRIEAKINQGALGLTHLNMAQNHLKKEEEFLNQKISSDQKIEILEKLENTSTREAERIVMGLSSVAVQIPTETIRPIAAELSELKAVLNKRQLEKIQKLKCLLAHKNPNMEFSELLDVLLDLGLKEFDLGQKVVRTPRKQTCEENSALPFQIVPFTAAPRSPKQSQPGQTKNVRFISAEVRRQVWKKYQSRCVNCKSTFALEIDHKIPVSLGGTSELQNLRLTCRSCNQRWAWKKLGAEVMGQYTCGR
ncbi:MAG: HNH endonuclease [Pseudobdellovibrionaceae bacterium]